MRESEQSTIQHIRRVQALLADVSNRLIQRAIVHDTSKLEEPEASIFDEFTVKLKGSTYGSDEYNQFLAEMKPALDHHYANNSHHPEHYGKHICIQCGADDRESPCSCGGPRSADLSGMTLLDLVEMLCDWKAAGERHENGSIAKSLEVNKKRFGYGEELQSILSRTVAELWGQETAGPINTNLSENTRRDRR